MVNVCNVMGCNNSPLPTLRTVFSIKKGHRLYQMCKRFIDVKRKNFHSETVYICSDHFDPNSFVNSSMFKSGFCKALKFHRDMVPTFMYSTQLTEDKSNGPAAGSSRSAYRKREEIRLHQRVVSESYLDDESMITDPPPGENDTQMEHDDVEPKFKEVETQTDMKSCVRCRQNTRRMNAWRLRVKASRKKKINKSTQCNRTKKVTTPAASQCSEEEKEEKVESQDESYHPSQASSISTDNTTEPYKEEKFIVYRSCLLQLFTKCTACSSPCEVAIKHRSGTYICISKKCCQCLAEEEWSSQPFVNSIPSGNLSLSAAILFSGMCPTKALRMMQFANISCHTVSTYHRHASVYLHPAVCTFWMAMKMDFVEELKDMNGSCMLGGDMRADSPGHNAKYGSYSLMELRINKIIDFELVQSNEVGSSNNMELEGLIRAIDYVESEGLEWEGLVTDRHLPTQKFMREEYPDKKHWNDVWHTAKSTRKKVNAVGGLKECGDVKSWAKSITNHMYWTAKTSEGNGDLAEAKWTSMVNHLQNVHIHDNPLFPKCQHGDITAKKWIKPGTKSCEKLTKLLLSTRMLKDVRRLSPHHQTSNIEGFHSVIIHYCPKSVVFSFKAMFIRLALAAIHFNRNMDRPQARTAEGKLAYAVRFPKFKAKGEHSVQIIKEAANYDYVEELMELLMGDVVYNQASHAVALNDINVPPPLCHGFDRPDKDEVIAAITSRFK